MEIRKDIGKLGRICILAVAFLFMPVLLSAQIYKLRDGKMYIEIDKHIDEKKLDDFIKHFDLSDLALKYFIKTNQQDSLKLLGWRVETNTQNLIAISKSLISAEDLTNVATKIIFTEKDAHAAGTFPSVNFGYNKFKNNTSFTTSDSAVQFFLRNYTNANRVMLAGSFNSWSPDKLPMRKTDSGWVATVKLGPGKHWYKFIFDGNWILDPNNQLNENDGLGNTNSVFYKTNYLFKLDTFATAKKIYIAGSFNNWREKELLLQKTSTGWALPVYIADGTYTYKYIVDGSWKTDPGNPKKFPNEFNDFNSVVQFGKPYLFKLNGFESARNVLLSGSFNNWRKDELFMNKTSTGWELPYALGAGNYEYKFIADGKEMTDPGNNLTVNKNSYLILEPNYTFILKGYATAKEVFLGGDFNNFSPNSLAMKKVGDDWVFSVYLSRGKHTYKFIVDGKWIKDPANKQWEQNQYQTGNSVIWIGD